LLADLGLVKNAIKTDLAGDLPLGHGDELAVRVENELPLLISACQHAIKLEYIRAVEALRKFIVVESIEAGNRCDRILSQTKHIARSCEDHWLLPKGKHTICESSSNNIFENPEVSDSVLAGGGLVSAVETGIAEALQLHQDGLGDDAIFVGNTDDMHGVLEVGDASRVTQLLRLTGRLD
jgi:hypothetical protein